MCPSLLHVSIMWLKISHKVCADHVYVVDLQYEKIYMNLYKSTPGVLPGTWVNKATGETITYSNWRYDRPCCADKPTAHLVREWGYLWGDAGGDMEYNYICKMNRY